MQSWAGGAAACRPRDHDPGHLALVRGRSAVIAQGIDVALGRLGIPTGFFSGLSTDFFGDSLKATKEE
jgi:sugar/nucleoside kinase (ribokinase family)